jgi:hypothetical protein
MRSMEIGVAHAAGFGLDHYLARQRRGDGPFPKNQWFPELFDDCGVHLECHG